jgi:hypothetical protein
MRPYSEDLRERAVQRAEAGDTIRELAADRRVENRIVAVTTLALLGEYDDLVELLSADASGRKLEGRQWLMLEADTVPLALARGERSAERLREAFEDRGPHGKGDQLYEMARGFTNDELAAGADQALVAALEDDDLVVRRYASTCLCDIVPPPATDRLLHWDRDHVWHAFTQMQEYEPLLIERGEGSWLVDTEGNRYLDGSASMWCNVHGHGQPRLDEALLAQAGKVAHTTNLGLSNPTTIEFAWRLVEVAPTGLDKVFFTGDGSSAI